MRFGCLCCLLLLSATGAFGQTAGTPTTREMNLIGLYEPGQGYPTFDKAKAKEYYQKVNDKIFRLIDEVIRKWDMAKLYEE